MGWAGLYRASRGRQTLVPEPGHPPTKGEKVFAAVMKDPDVERLSHILGAGSESSRGVLEKEKPRASAHRGEPREEGTEMGGAWPQEKDFQGPRSQESRKDPPLEPAEGAWCCGRWILTSVLQTVREGTSDDVSPHTGRQCWADRDCARAARQGVCPALPTSPICQSGPCGIPVENMALGPGTHTPNRPHFPSQHVNVILIPCEGVRCGVTCSTSLTPSSNPGTQSWAPLPSRRPPPHSPRSGTASRRRQHPLAVFSPPTPSSGDPGMAPSSLQRTLRRHQALGALPSARLPPSLPGDVTQAEASAVWGPDACLRV